MAAIVAQCSTIRGGSAFTDVVELMNTRQRFSSLKSQDQMHFKVVRSTQLTDIGVEHG